MQCGREPDGQKVEELGVCPAAVEASFDGINIHDDLNSILQTRGSHVA